MTAWGEARFRSVEAAVELWRAVDAEQRRLAEDSQVGDLAQWVQTAELVRHCGVGASVEAGVAAGVAEWRRRKEMGKQGQSIWDASGNETTGSESATAEPEPEPEEAEPVSHSPCTLVCHFPNNRIALRRSSV